MLAAPFLVLACLFALPAVGALIYPVVKLADTSTPIPDGTGTFTSFDAPSGRRGEHPPAGIPNNPYNTDFAFRATGDGGYRGIFRFGPSYGPRGPGYPWYFGDRLNRVADTTMPMPGTSGNYLDFSSPSFASAGFFSGDIAWLGTGQSNSGIYVNNQLAVLTTDLRDDGTTVGTIARPSLNPVMSADEAGFAAFRSSSIFRRAIMTTAPGVRQAYVVADTQTVVPGTTSTFTQFGDPVMTNVPGARSVAFYGASATRSGIYSATLTTVRTVVDDTTLLADGRRFTSFVGDPIVTGMFAGIATFIANTSDGAQGIYEVNIPSGFPGESRPIWLLADTKTIAPAGGRFTAFLQISSDFWASTYFLASTEDGRRGIYFKHYDNSIKKVIDTTDLLDGKEIATIEMSREAVRALNTTTNSPTDVGFKVLFIDGSQGVYVITVPEPMALASFTAVALWLCAARAPRRKLSHS